MLLKHHESFTYGRLHISHNRRFKLVSCWSYRMGCRRNFRRTGRVGLANHLRLGRYCGAYRSIFTQEQLQTMRDKNPGNAGIVGLKTCNNQPS